jgi:hypothetical protein
MGSAELYIEDLDATIADGRKAKREEAVRQRRNLRLFLGKAAAFVSGDAESAESVRSAAEIMRMVPQWFDL